MLAVGLLALSLQISYEVTLVKDAIKQVDSVAKWSRAHRVETAMCVAKYTSKVTDDGMYHVVVEKFRSVEIVKASALAVTWVRDRFDAPCMHTHLLALGAIKTPSPIDFADEAADRGEFQMIVLLSERYVPYDIILYNIKLPKQ